MKNESHMPLVFLLSVTALVFCSIWGSGGYVSPASRRKLAQDELVTLLTNLDDPSDVIVAVGASATATVEAMADSSVPSSTGFDSSSSDSTGPDSDGSDSTGLDGDRRLATTVEWLVQTVTYQESVAALEEAVAAMAIPPTTESTTSESNTSESTTSESTSSRSETETSSDSFTDSSTESSTPPPLPTTVFFKTVDGDECETYDLLTSSEECVEAAIALLPSYDGSAPAQRSSSKLPRCYTQGNERTINWNLNEATSGRGGKVALCKEQMYYKGAARSSCISSSDVITSIQECQHAGLTLVADGKLSSASIVTKSKTMQIGGCMIRKGVLYWNSDSMVETSKGDKPVCKDNADAA